MTLQPFEYLSDEDLFQSLKETARAYLFQAGKYNLMESSDYVMERWGDLVRDIQPGTPGFTDDYARGVFDDEVDPSGFLRVFSVISSRFAQETLKLFNQPVPGSWRISLASYGLAPH